MGFASSLLLLFTFASTWLSAFLPLSVFTDRHPAGLDWLVASTADGFCLFSAHFPLKFPYFPLVSDENGAIDDSSVRFLYSTLASMKDELCYPSSQKWKISTKFH